MTPLTARGKRMTPLTTLGIYEVAGSFLRRFQDSLKTPRIHQESCYCNGFQKQLMSRQTASSSPRRICDSVTGSDSSGFLAEVTDAERMRSVVEEHLLAPGDPPVEVVACEVEFGRRGSRSLVQYRVTLRDPVGGSEWTQVVSGVAYGGQRTRKIWERLQQHPATAAGAVLLPAAYEPELDLLLQVFPFDHQLPALEPLMAGPLPGLVAHLLARFGPGDWQLEVWDAESMRYRVDLRASVRLSVRAREAASGRVAEQRFFAKVYASAKTAGRVWGNQREVAAALAGGNGLLAVAPLVAYLPDERVLVQDEVPGLSLRHLLRSTTGIAGPAEAVRRTARAIAALHRLDISAPGRAPTCGAALSPWRCRTGASPRCRRERSSSRSAGGSFPIGVLSHYSVNRRRTARCSAPTTIPCERVRGNGTLGERFACNWVCFSVHKTVRMTHRNLGIPSPERIARQL
jgi:hypothetical protein